MQTANVLKLRVKQRCQVLVQPCLQQPAGSDKHRCKEARVTPPRERKGRKGLSAVRVRSEASTHRGEAQGRDHVAWRDSQGIVDTAHQVRTQREQHRVHGVSFHVRVCVSVSVCVCVCVCVHMCACLPFYPPLTHTHTRTHAHTHTCIQTFSKAQW